MPTGTSPVDEALENQRALELDSLKSTRPIHADVQTPAEIDEVFDAITYEKGAAVVRMIEGYVGADTFRRGVNAYLEAHAYGNATSEDFWTAIAGDVGQAGRAHPADVRQPARRSAARRRRSSCAGDRTAVTLKQQRFFARVDGAGWPSVGRAMADRPSAQGGRAGGRADHVDVLSECVQNDHPRRQRCAPWVFANAGARGYFRTAYSPAMLRAIAPHVATRADARPSGCRSSTTSGRWCARAATPSPTT